METGLVLAVSQCCVGSCNVSIKTLETEVRVSEGTALSSLSVRLNYSSSKLLVQSFVLEKY